MTNITEADRELAEDFIIESRGKSEHFVTEELALLCAEVREAGEAKGREETEHLLRANQAMSQDAVDWSRILNLPFDPVETLSHRIGAAILALLGRVKTAEAKGRADALEECASYAAAYGEQWNKPGMAAVWAKQFGELMAEEFRARAEVKT